MSHSVLIEACVDSVASALAAASGGAHRLELCDDLVEGGTTPSAGMIALVRERVPLALHVLVRPRGGDFLYSADDVAVMLRDIAVARELGADGVVIGALTPDGAIDVPLTRRLARAARPLRLTFHRAFDFTRDLPASLEALAGIGVERVLTSGGAASALDGMGTIAELRQRAAGRITILAGGGITEENAARIVRGTGVRELHVRGATRMASAMRYRRPGVTVGKPCDPADDGRAITDPARIARLVATLSGSVTSGDSPARLAAPRPHSARSPRRGTNDA